MEKKKMKLKTLKEISKVSKFLLKEDGKDIYSKEAVLVDDLKQEAIKDLLNIYNLEKVLKIKLNDKTIGILNKYIIWKNNITEEDLT